MFRKSVFAKYRSLFSLSYSWLFFSKKEKRGFSQGQSVLASVFSLSIGVLALSITLALVSGFEHKLEDSLRDAGGDLKIYTSWKQAEDLDVFVSTLPQEFKDSHVEASFRTQVLVYSRFAAKGAFVSVTSSLKDLLWYKNEEVVSSSHEPQAVHLKLGQQLAKNLKVTVGDALRLSLPKILSKPLNAKVRTIQKVGLQEIDSRFLEISLVDLLALLKVKQPNVYSSRQGDAMALNFYFPQDVLKLGDLHTLSDLKATLSQKSKKYFSKDYTIKTWRDKKKNYLSAIGDDKKLLVIVLSLLTIVASLNVAASLMLLYFQRDRDFAVLRAIGLSQVTTKKWIVLKGSLIGFVSSCLGLILSFVLSFVLTHGQFLKLPEEIYNFSTLPFKYLFAEQALVFVFGFISATAVAYVLARKLSKEKIVESLGHRR